MTKESYEYLLISEHYGNKIASRSRVPLINHINQGLVVLHEINATTKARRAFCAHPLFQADDDLKVNSHLSQFIDSTVLMLTMEYRSVANDYLSYKVNTGHRIRLSPLPEVNDMLIADKVQNYKDFITYHKDTHARSKDLDTYFNEWLTVLGVDNQNFLDFCKLIDETATNDELY